MPGSFACRTVFRHGDEAIAAVATELTATEEKAEELVGVIFKNPLSIRVNTNISDCSFGDTIGNHNIG